jgi:FtsH-binding integral membrane protein
MEFDRFAALGRFDHIEPRVQTHLKSVYSCLFIAMLCAAAGSYVHLFTNTLQGGGLMTTLGVIGLMMWLYSVPHEPKNVGKRVGILSGIGFLTGLSLGPLLQLSISIEPSIVPTAFLGSCVIFGSFSLAALYSRERSWLYLGGTLMSVLSWMFMASVLNMFLGSQLLFQANVYVGLVVFCLFILYDTQMIIEKRRLGDDDFIWHSVDLFLDLVAIFRRLLIILSQNEEDKKKRRR